MGKILQNIDEKTFNKTKEFLLDSFFSHICCEKLLNSKELNNAHKLCVATKSFDLVSIAMSYLALNNYRQGARYYQTLSLLNDAKYLANSANDLIAQNKAITEAQGYSSKPQQVFVGNWKEIYEGFDKLHKKLFWRDVIKQIVVDENLNVVDVIFL